MHMGFPKERVEKALAATGNNGVQLATDWLLSHINDPCLDMNTPRDYFVYLCPKGNLLRDLQDFWVTSAAKCGRNKAHNYFPHITLCPMFKVEDSKLDVMVKLFEKVIDRFTNESHRLGLEYFASDNFIGMFVTEEGERFMKKVVTDLAEEAKTIGVTLENYKKQLHLSLAYKFYPKHKAMLESLAHRVNTTAQTGWDFRLYSRDPRSRDTEVKKVLGINSAFYPDELDLFPGDFILVNEKTKEIDGWSEGTSWLTGISGRFPLAYTEPTAEMDTWIKHVQRPYYAAACSEPEPMENEVSVYETIYNSHTTNNTPELLKSTVPIYAKVDKTAKAKARETNAVATNKENGPRHVYVLRHGERIDFTFGRRWLEECFDEQGNYSRQDLNQPRTVPYRRKKYAYIKDCPLTEFGVFHARATGEAMKEAGVQIDFAYVSPALRCVQTASACLEGMGLSTSVPLRLDCDVFEWLGWHKQDMPEWFSPEEFKELGYNIDLSYVPQMKTSDLNPEESIEAYYNRNHVFVRKLIENHQAVGNIFIVGHAGTIDTMTRQLTGRTPVLNDKFFQMVQNIPYCSLVHCKESQQGRKWSLVEPPVLPMTSRGNKKFNWRVVLQY
ncbi:ecdysteroid-phosphate phosphatase-like isoform X2 [Lineus longissimus]|uniref:ecdysteroid-phosphate phosphatase-like isoform X2 n=1 Tax=Lineus longissimus TaxID=88925 RepID=UPI00315CC8C1